MFNEIQISLGFAPFKHGKKNKLSDYFSARLCLKKKVLKEFPPKYFKTTERHSLAVCGSLWGEKHFLLIFIPFYGFDQKNLFKQIQIFLWICPYQTWNKFLSTLVLVSEIVTLCLKREVLCEFPQICFKTTERYSLALCGSLCGEKQFLLIFIPFYRFD